MIRFITFYHTCFIVPFILELIKPNHCFLPIAFVIKLKLFETLRSRVYCGVTILPINLLFLGVFAIIYHRPTGRHFAVSAGFWDSAYLKILLHTENKLKNVKTSRTGFLVIFLQMKENS